jgi:hypothetical protein
MANQTGKPARRRDRDQGRGFRTHSEGNSPTPETGREQQQDAANPKGGDAGATEEKAHRSDRGFRPPSD